jgi:hypothetical protein
MTKNTERGDGAKDESKEPALEKEKLRDLDVPANDAGEIVGGARPSAGVQCTAFCSP